MEHLRRFYDLTGIVVIRELSRVASLRGVDLPDNVRDFAHGDPRSTRSWN